MDINYGYKGFLVTTIRINYKDLHKLSNTDQLAIRKILELLNEYNQDIPYKSLLAYMDEPIKMLSKLKEYCID
jgi:Txe/YoeB family toxin of Txe-Axe toxin-antitoxin module